ncbi:hypothetical protein BKG86_17100 [Mycobacteroides chelonae]|uniref:hypothetical protein n=1 Tax=Mycobacteroides chelonae TaxID=1774 RepID=UPI0008A9B034|nr:hypothetical protein [Mycobacteroides chelonae]OHU71371.1 hypothetical protein BKG86_17100 [Mycobacteroides chelonae]
MDIYAGAHELQQERPSSREIVDSEAVANGWTILTDAHGAIRPDGHIVAYERCASQILICWGADDYACWVVMDHGTPHERRPAPRMGLVEVRQWLVEEVGR